MVSLCGVKRSASESSPSSDCLTVPSLCQEPQGLGVDLVHVCCLLQNFTHACALVCWFMSNRASSGGLQTRSCHHNARQHLKVLIAALLFKDDLWSWGIWLPGESEQDLAYFWEAALFHTAIRSHLQPWRRKAGGIARVLLWSGIRYNNTTCSTRSLLPTWKIIEGHETQTGKNICTSTPLQPCLPVSLIYHSS